MKSSATEFSFAVEEATISNVHAALRSGQVTCRWLVEQYLRRIDAYSASGPKLNAFINLNPTALAEADALDEEFRATGRLRPLHGIPVSLKDSIHTAGIPTTGGSVLLKDSVPANDAYLVSRLKEAGAIVLGKNTLGDLSGSSYSTLVGVPRNPYNTNRAPGGSSSGCGVSVAANLALVAVGEDTFTSVRTPAALNNVVGLRPTTGLISGTGLIPRKEGIDTAGPMARTVWDAALLLNAIAGPDSTDALSVRTFGRFEQHAKKDKGYVDFTTYLKSDALNGARIGVGRDFFGGDPEIDRLAEDAIGVMKRLGAEVVDVRFEENFFNTYIRDGVHTLMPILMYPFREVFESYLATLSPELPKTVEEWSRLYETEVSASRFPPERVRASQAIFVLKEALLHSSQEPAYQSLINETLPMLTREKRATFERHNISALVMPYQPMFAEPIVTPLEQQTDPAFLAAPGKPAPNSIAGYGSEGFPMAIVPMGFGSQGLPMGLAIMGLPYMDGEILGYAYAYEQATKHRRPPISAPEL